MKNYVNHDDLFNELIKLSAKDITLEEYLDSVADIICDWSDCRCVEIRLLNEKSNDLYRSDSGIISELPKSQIDSPVREDTAVYEGKINNVVIPLHQIDKQLGTIRLIYNSDRKMSLTKVEFLEKISYLIRDTIYRLNTEERYRSLFEFAPDAVIIYDENKILLANDAGAKLLGGDDVEEFTGTPIMNYVHPEYREIVKKRDQQILKNGKSLPMIEEKFISKNGTVTDVEVKAAPFFYNGKLVVLNIIRDISDRKRAEELQKIINEKEKLLDKAMEYENLRAGFYADISHELRAPLTLMFATMQMCELYINEGVLDSKGEKLDKYMRTMKQNCYRLLRLVNNLIDISKISTGFFKINFQNQNIVSIIENISSSVTEFVKNKGLYFIFDTEIEEKIIGCDPDIIERIMLNLLSNAVKFTSVGGIMVNLLDKGDSIVISVKDTGVGIPEDKQWEVFERFKQVDNSFTKTCQGSGIGLSLVKSLVEMHDGKISVKSEYGKGSEFIIELPVCLVEEGNAAFDKDTDNIQHCHIEKINIEFSDIYS